MADNGQGAYLEAAFHGGVRPTFGEKAPEVHLNRAVLERGMAEGHGGGGGMARATPARAGGSRQRGTLESAFDKNGDPAVTGDFETNPYAGTGLISNAIYGAGKLSDAGKRQEADYNILKQGQTLYAQALMSGASQQQAAQHALKALGPQQAVSFLSALMSHPSSPLASAGAFHNFLAGNGLNTPTEAFGPVTKEGQQLVTDPNTGEAIRAQDVPGFKSAESQKFHAPIIKETPNGYVAIDPTNPSQALPIAAPGPNGIGPAMPMPKGKQPAAPVPAIAPETGLAPQYPAPAKSIKAADAKVLESAPTLMTAMEDMLTQSRNMGLATGPLKEAAGEYFGINGTGAAFKRDWDLIKSQAPLYQGSGYKSATETFMGAVPTANNAPSFAAAAIPSLMEAVRIRAQGAADSQGGFIPQSMATPLVAHGIIPNGYQNQQTFEALGPSKTALWKAQNAPQSMTDQDRQTFYGDAANGVYGPSGAIASPARKLAVSMANQYRTQQQTVQQQAGAAKSADQVVAPKSPQATLQPGATTTPQPPASPESINPPREGEAQRSPSQLITNGHVPGVTSDRGQGEATPNARQLVAAGVNPPNAATTEPTFAPGVQPGGQPAAAAAAPSIAAPGAPPPKPAPAPEPVLKAPSSYEGARLEGQSGTDAQGNPYATAPIEPMVPAESLRTPPPQRPPQGSPAATPYVPPNAASGTAGDIPIFPGGM